jgi:glycosyltransferase involved in cell wall biosynthesis
MSGARDISVVIDTFNQVPFIERAVESALAQDWTGRVEVIVVDDGSTDDTAARLERLGTHVRVIRRENGGQAAALATGIAASTRSLIALLDGDDEWRPDHLTKVCEAAERAGNAPVIWSLTERVDAQGRAIAADPPDALRASYARRPPDVAAACAGLVPWFPPTSGIAADGVLLRRLARNLPRKLRVAADGWLQVALSLSATSFAWNLERTVKLRVHSANAWTGRDDFDLEVLRARRALYVHLADEVVTLDDARPRRAVGLEASLRAQSQEFAIWEEIVRGRQAEALKLARDWAPPPWLRGVRRMFRRAHTLLASLIPVKAYQALRAMWRAIT